MKTEVNRFGGSEDFCLDNGVEFKIITEDNLFNGQSRTNQNKRSSDQTSLIQDPDDKMLLIMDILKDMDVVPEG